MDTLPLPPRPRVEQYRKRGKALVAAAHSSDSNAVREWSRHWLESLAKLLNEPITPFVASSIDRAIEHIAKRVRTTGASFTLADAQYLLADAHGFESWGAFVRHLEAISDVPARTDPFEAAADAVVNGDLAALESLVRAHPDLVRARSTRVHRATLLHYVAANGVEDFRQKTPPNAVAIARFLLDAGADVDAVAETYGGGNIQTTMNLLVSSAHPAGAGLQSALVEVLLDHGAKIDGVDDDESPIMTALAFGYRGASETLARRGARLDSVLAAAALGRLDLVRQYVVDATTLAPGVPLVAPPWFTVPRDPRAHIELALVWACAFNRSDVAEFLLDQGVNPSSKDGSAMTALHFAAANGNIALVDNLLGRGASLEALNDWDGTVLGSTAHFAVHMPVKGVDYDAVLEALIARGARVRSAYPSGNAHIDALLERHL